MATPQNGIFAHGTHAHHFLEFNLKKNILDAQTIAALERLRAPVVSAGGINYVIAFGPDVWRHIAPKQAPADLASFKEIALSGETLVPAHQHDVWIWISGSSPDITFDNARATWLALRDVASLEDEQQAHEYHDSRDLTGFVDGTANPEPLNAPDVALVPNGLPGEGGSHVLVMRWVHNLEAFHALPIPEQENVIGRTKADNVELTGARLPVNAHIARTQVKVDGEELPIFRRSVPFGTVGKHGLYFVAFSAERARYDRMLERMFGMAEDRVRDRLTDFSRAMGGAFYFAPSLTLLREMTTAAT
jgi:porphyrinogen peroxidase